MFKRLLSILLTVLVGFVVFIGLRAYNKPLERQPHFIMLVRADAARSLCGFEIDENKFTATANAVAEWNGIDPLAIAFYLIADVPRYINNISTQNKVQTFCHDSEHPLNIR